MQLKFIFISLTIFWNYVAWQLPSTVSYLFLFFNALTCFRYFSQFKKWWSLRSSCADWWKGWQGLFEVFNVRTHFVSAVHTPKSVLNRTCFKRGKKQRSGTELQASVSLMFLPHFDVLCDLLLHRPTTKWNLFVLSEAYASGFMQRSEKKKNTYKYT